MNILGESIKKLRLNHKMTQSELGKLTGFKQNTISQHGWCIGYSRKSKRRVFVDIIVFSKASQVE